MDFNCFVMKVFKDFNCFVMKVFKDEFSRIGTVLLHIKVGEDDKYGSFSQIFSIVTFS